MPGEVPRHLDRHAANIRVEKRGRASGACGLAGPDGSRAAARCGRCGAGGAGASCAARRRAAAGQRPRAQLDRLPQGGGAAPCGRACDRQHRALSFCSLFGERSRGVRGMHAGRLRCFFARAQGALSSAVWSDQAACGVWSRHGRRLLGSRRRARHSGTALPVRQPS